MPRSGCCIVPGTSASWQCVCESLQFSDCVESRYELRSCTHEDLRQGQHLQRWLRSYSSTGGSSQRAHVVKNMGSRHARRRPHTSAFKLCFIASAGCCRHRPRGAASRCGCRSGRSRTGRMEPGPKVRVPQAALTGFKRHTVWFRDLPSIGGHHCGDIIWCSQPCDAYHRAQPSFAAHDHASPCGGVCLPEPNLGVATPPMLHLSAWFKVSRAVQGRRRCGRQHREARS